MSSRTPSRRVVAFIVGVFCCGSISCSDRTGTTATPSVANSSTPTGAAKTGKRSIDETLKSLLAAWKTVESVSAKIKTKAKRDIGDRAISTGEGVYNLQRKDGRIRLRYYVGSMINFWVKEERFFTPEHVEFVTDGNILTHLTAQNKNRQVVKTRYNPTDVLQLGGRFVIDPLRANNTIKSVTPQQRDGRSELVFECVANDGGWTSTHTFDVETGIRVGWVERDASGEEVLSVMLENLNLSPEFTEEDLAMVKAADYTLIDETGPERVVTPWEELKKTLGVEDPAEPDEKNDDSKNEADTPVETDPK